MAGEPGFEPRFTESKSAVLPIILFPNDYQCLITPATINILVTI